MKLLRPQAKFWGFGVMSLSAAGENFDKFEVRMRFSIRKLEVWESDFSKISRACGAPFFGNAIFYRNSISVFFSGIAVFINKLDIRA